MLETIVQSCSLTIHTASEELIFEYMFSANLPFGDHGNQLN